MPDNKSGSKDGTEKKTLEEIERKEQSIKDLAIYLNGGEDNKSFSCTPSGVQGKWPAAWEASVLINSVEKPSVTKSVTTGPRALSKLEVLCELEQELLKIRKKRESGAESPEEAEGDNEGEKGN